MNYMDRYESWLNDPALDVQTRKELAAIKGDEDEIRDRFFMELEFGTGGLRGVIGAGTNRMNRYVVRRATQGLANYIIKAGTQDKGVVIAHDSRRMSPEFAKETALVLAENGIRAYVFRGLRPTPELSFAVRHYGCTAGVNITASHNPAEYNGYKVYWADGAQITPPHDCGIMEEVNAICGYGSLAAMDEDVARAEGLFVGIGKDVDNAYNAAVLAQIRSPECIRQEGSNLKIVYTPLHGAGLVPVTRALGEAGFKNVIVVPQQKEPDGNFPTVEYPNPESREAFELALELAKKEDADIVLATDPDADRLGVYVRESGGGYRMLTGNMSGCVLADYEIGRMRETSGLPEDGVLIKTIVTTNMADAIAKKYGVQLKEVLTGFKYIGEQIMLMEQAGRGTFLFGFEESYGCLTGTYTRDKDAVGAAVALCDAAAYYRTRGMTLSDALDALYSELGYYMDGLFSVTKKGMDGRSAIAAIMESLRKEPPKEAGGFKVLAVRDYGSGIRKDLINDSKSRLNLPKSNVMYFELENDAWFCVRPSGTEPKIKTYYGVAGKDAGEAAHNAAVLKEALKKLIR